jgi:outer membrane protein assembly factor BamA
MHLLKCVLAAGFAILVTSAAFAQQQPEPADPNGPTQAVAAAAAPPVQDDDAGFVQKAKDWADDHQLAERLNGDVDGWYPRLGGMTRGGGFAVGPGYRFHAGTVLVDVSGAISTKVYKAGDVKVRWFEASDNHFEFWTNYRYEDFTQEDFYGIGVDSLEANRTAYGFRSHNISAQGIFKPVTWLRTGATIGYLNPDIGAGRDANFPTIQAVFTDDQAPGLVEQPDFVHTTLFADIDYRDQKGNPRSGGFYHAAFGIWDDHSFDRYDFRRFDLNLWQHVPLVASKRHVVSGHVGVSYVNNETAQQVPFYFLPYVGGVDTVRGFKEFRFKDENAMWMSAEYNYAVIKNLSLAAFIDAGKVAHDWEDIGFSDLKRAYGVGVRVHTRKATFLRLDLGTGGGEGWHTFLKLGAGF